MVNNDFQFQKSSIHNKIHCTKKYFQITSVDINAAVC